MPVCLPARVCYLNFNCAKGLPWSHEKILTFTNPLLTPSMPVSLFGTMMMQCTHASMEYIGVGTLFPLFMCEWTGMSEVAVVAVYKQFEQRPFW